MALNNNLQSASCCYDFSLSSPFVCIDNYLLLCEWKATTFVPKKIIDLSDLKARMRKELDERKLEKNEYPRLRSLTDRRGSDSNVFAREASKSKRTDKGRRKYKSWDGNDCWEKCFALNTSRHDIVLVETDTKTHDKAAMDENNANKRREYSRSVSYICSECEDYINTESPERIEDLIMLIEIIMKSKTPAMFTVRLQSETDLCITYQFLPRFKQEYMIVRVNPQYCILMKTF